MTTDTTHPPAGVRWVRVLLPLTLAVAVAALAAAALLTPPWKRDRVQRGPAPTEQPSRLEYPLPEFAFAERGGGRVTKADLAGKVWVASFVFTRCTGPCPSVTATMARLQAELRLAEAEDVRLVTFTVDPARDDAAELAKYADKFRAEKGKWLFLTGPEPAVHELLNKSFKIQAGRSADPHPPAGQEYDHSTRLAVVDKAGNVRGYFDGYQGPNDAGGEGYAAGLDRLKALVAELRAE